MTENWSALDADEKRIPASAPACSHRDEKSQPISQVITSFGENSFILLPYSISILDWFKFVCQFREVNAALIAMDLLDRLTSASVTKIVHSRIERHVADTCKGNFTVSHLVT